MSKRVTKLAMASALIAGALAATLIIIPLDADARGGGGRGGFGGGGRGFEGGGRSAPTSINRGGREFEGHRNTNFNVNRNVNVNVDNRYNDYHGGGYYGGDYHPVATGVAVGVAAGVTAAAIGSLAYSLPSAARLTPTVVPTTSAATSGTSLSTKAAASPTWWSTRRVDHSFRSGRNSTQPDDGGIDQVSMKEFIEVRSFSLLMVVAVLLVVVLAQAEIFFSISFGRLRAVRPSRSGGTRFGSAGLSCGARSSPRASACGCSTASACCSERSC